MKIAWFGAGTLLAMAAAGGCGPTVVREDGAGGAGAFHGLGGEPTTVTVGMGSTADVAASSSSASTSSSGGGGAPVIPPLVETSFGEVPMGATLSFDVPPNTLGITAIVDPPGSLDRAGVQTLLPPAGPPVIDRFHIPGTAWEFAWYGITIAAVPQSDAPAAMPVMPGTWQLEVGAIEGDVPAAKVTLWRRQTLDGLFYGGVLDVNVFGAPGVVDQAYMKDVLFDAYGDYAGLGLGTVSFLPLPPEHEVIDSMDQLFAALEETKGAPGKPALNVLVVGLITGELEGAAGLAAGIPGLGLEHGTHSSGVVVMIYGDPFLDRIVLRHEAGHLAGLFHTTEIEPGFADALDDTPECPDVEALLDQCPDATNVMFPLGGTGDGFTPKQARVIQGSALYRGAVERGGGLPEPLDGDTGELDGETGSEDGFDVRLREHHHDCGPHLDCGRKHAALPDRLWRLLASPRCGHTPFASWLGVLERAGGDVDELLGVALDPDAPVTARRTALALLGRRTPPPDVMDTLVEIAHDRTAPKLVRAGAIEGLAAAGARDRVAPLAADPDSTIAVQARRIAR